MRKLLPALILLYALAPLWGAGSSLQSDKKPGAKNPAQEKARGEILAKWKEMGAERSPLGSPVGDVQEAIGGGLQRTFRNGIIRWSPQSGLDVTVLDGVIFTENQLIVSEGAVLTRTSGNTFQIRRAPQSPPQTEGKFTCGCPPATTGRCAIDFDNNTLSCRGGCGCKLKVTILR
jgi:hypothetical protein